jgi:PAS domain-containing protein
MDNSRDEAFDASALRMQAVNRIADRGGNPAAKEDPFMGLRALYDLASTPATAERALALLHELQVHQIELELQDEELRRSRAEVEDALLRQQQLFDHLPIAFLIMDGASAVISANLEAGRLLGLGRDALVGRRLDGFLAKDSALRLLALLAVPDRVFSRTPLELARTGDNGEPVQVIPRMSRDPDGRHFLVALHEG